MTRLSDLMRAARKPPEPLTVLIAGGAGFIGSHLCDRMLAQGRRVICVDRLSTGRLENIRPLTGHPSFTFLHHDIARPLAIEGPVDRICNLACPGAPRHDRRDPTDTLRTCVTGTLNLLDLAGAKSAPFLQGSACEIYGDPDIHPQPEAYRGNVDPVGPRACYEEGKRCAEAACFDYGRRFGLPVKVARIFDTYGPRMPEEDGRVLAAFIVRALRNAPLPVDGDGRQTRSFCFVADLVRGLELLLESPAVVTGPVNLGHPHEIPVRRLAERIVEQTRSRSVIEHRPPLKDGARRRRPDIALARNELGWEPVVELDEGLRATIDYFLLRGVHLRRGEGRQDGALRSGRAAPGPAQPGREPAGAAASSQALP